jgi:hypothetical protein
VCKSVADAADRQYSYVVVTTKAIPELTRTPQLLSPFLSASYNARFRQPTYVMMQNGLNVEVDLFDALTRLRLQGVLDEAPRILSVATWIAANLREPNIVDHGDFVSAYCPHIIIKGQMLIYKFADLGPCTAGRLSESRFHYNGEYCGRRGTASGFRKADQYGRWERFRCARNSTREVCQKFLECRLFFNRDSDGVCFDMKLWGTPRVLM